MPKVDLKTQIDHGDHDHDSSSSSEEEPTIPENPPDFPAESFYLSKEDEIDWVDRNAFYERKDSTKGNSGNSNSIYNSNNSTTSTSQRYSNTLKSKSSIIGLPKAPQNSCKFRISNNGKPSNVRFFPKRTKSSLPVTEPSSPKVSCIGRVRSRRQRLRQLSRQRSTTTVRSNKTGFWVSFKSVICLRCRETQAINIVEGSNESPQTPRKNYEKRKSSSSPTTTITEPQGLNELKRFASGRRFDSLSV